MTDVATNTATPPATSGGLSGDDLRQLITDSVSAVVDSKIKPLADQVGKIQSGHDSLTETLKKIPTAETLGKAVTDQLNAQKVSQSEADARTKFVGDKLKGLPAVYAKELGSDPSKWDAEATTIRETYRKDLEAQGLKPPAIGSDAPATAGATTPAKVLDISKLTGYQLLELGVKQSTPIPVNHTANAAAATAGGQPAKA